MEEQAPSMEAPKPASKSRALWIVIAVIVVVVVVVLAAVLSGLFAGERPEAIFFPGYPGAGDKLIPAWWQNRANWPVEWLYSEGLKAQDFIDRLDDAGVDVQTIEGTAPTAPEDAAILQSNTIFNSDYQAAYGTAPNLFDPHAYDALFALAMAFQKSQTLDTNSSAFKDALRNVTNPPGTVIRPGQWTEAKAAIEAGTDVDYVGASGSVNFDDFGEVGSDYEAWQVNASGGISRKQFIEEGSWLSGSSAAPTLNALAALPSVSPAQTEIKIGTLFDRTGQLADFGWDMENATRLARDQINNEGGVTINSADHTIVTIHEDDGTDTTKTTNGATKLVTVDQVEAVIGATASSMSIAAFGITRPAGIIQMSASSTSAALTPDTFDPTDQFWRTAPSDLLQGAAAAWYAFVERGWRAISILYVDNAYGRGLGAVFEEEFEARGGRILRAVPFSETAANVDANTILQALFTPGAGPADALAIPVARRMEGF